MWWNDETDQNDGHISNHERQHTNQKAWIWFAQLAQLAQLILDQRSNFSRTSWKSARVRWFSDVQTSKPLFSSRISQPHWRTRRSWVDPTWQKTQVVASLWRHMRDQPPESWGFPLRRCVTPWRSATVVWHGLAMKLWFGSSVWSWKSPFSDIFNGNMLYKWL